MHIDVLASRLRDEYRRLSGGAEWLSEPEFQAQLELDAGDDALLDEQWMSFSAVAHEFGAFANDPLFSQLLFVWAGPCPEEEFIDAFEMREAIAAGDFPAEFLAHLPTAEVGFTLHEAPPGHAAIYADEWGWRLARANPAQHWHVRTPLDLTALLPRV